MINWNTTNSNRLIAALMKTDTPNEMRDFLDDLLTENELETSVKKLTAAYQLSLAIPYSFIRDSTGLSSATIARVAKQLDNKKGGYCKALKRLNPHGSKKILFLD